MKAAADMMRTPPYASQQSTYIFPGTDWEDYEQEGTRAGENLKRGYEPLETFPAKWHNTVMNRFSIAIQQAKVALDNIYDEMKNIMTATEDNAGQPITPQTPSAGDVSQVLKAIRNITKLHKATASILGGVLSSAEAWGVAVGADGKMSVNTNLATDQHAGLVKSAATGTDPDRTYNVEVKTDGTMKVCVPWTDSQIALAYDGYTLSGGGNTIKIPSPNIANFRTTDSFITVFNINGYGDAKPPAAYADPLNSEYWRLPFACILYVWYGLKGTGGATYTWGVTLVDGLNHLQMPCRLNISEANGSLSTLIIPAGTSFCFSYTDLSDVTRVIGPTETPSYATVGRAFIVRLSADA